MKKILFILLTIGLFSCVDDEGNYDYIAVNEVEINEISLEGDTLEGIASRNLLSKLDTVKIKLAVSGTIDKNNLDNYDFEWYICHDNHTHTVISQEKDLVYPLDLNPGQYAFYVQVTDRSTDLKWHRYVSVNVMTPITRGFLILGDLEDGSVGMDMVAMPVGKDTTVIEDLFDNSEWGLSYAEKLLFAGYRYGDEGKAQALWMETKEGSYRLTNQREISCIAEATDFQMIEMELDYKKPIRILDMFPHPTTSNRSSTYRGYITEDLVVFNMTIQAEFFTTPVNRYTANSTTLFKPYPLAFIAGAYNSGYNCVVLYDMDNDCFVKINGTSGASSCLQLYDYASDIFPWNNWRVGRKLVYGENSYDGSYGASYAIMKDGSNNLFIYKFTCQGGWFGPGVYKNGCYTIDLSVATDFDKASHYAFAANQTRLMYSVGSKLYMYDYTRQQIEVRDFGAEITYLETEYCSRGEKNAFLMATYDAQEKGIIRKLTVGSNPNMVEIIDRPNEVWKTRLKVKDMEWKYTP